MPGRHSGSLWYSFAVKARAKSRRRMGCTVLLFLSVALAIGVAVWPDAKQQDPLTAPEPERYPNPYKGPAPADVTLLLDGLVRGSKLDGDFTVRGVSPPEARRIIIDVERGDLGFRVWLTRKGADERRPPASSARYALYVVQPRPSSEAITDDMKKAVLSDIKRRLKKTEANAAVPAGL